MKTEKNVSTTTQLKTKRSKPKINVSYCEGKSFVECEQEVVKNAVKEADNIKKAGVLTENVKKMVAIVEEFIINKGLICYGGTAINNILPKHAQFYDKTTEIPDYDFFSPNALEDAKELAEIYNKASFGSVEAKSGVHFGTFKVFTEYIPIADITSVDPEIYKTLLKDAVTVDGIRYCPPDYLRMNMYLELSRPAGDTSRWEKVISRLLLLNKYHPMTIKNDCGDLVKKIKNDKEFDNTRELLKDELINQDVIFFGDFALNLYSEYMSGDIKHLAKDFKTFRVIHEDPKKCADSLVENLEREGVKNVKVIEHEEIGEIIPNALEVKIDNVTRVVIYEPLACHAFNKTEIDNKPVKIATIDTIMTFYLAMYYTCRDKDFKTRIFCIANQLFELTQKRLDETGILKRFSTTCDGEQTTLTSMRAEKTNKRNELKNKKDTKEYEAWFLNFNPASKKEKKEDKNPSTEPTESSDSEKNIKHKNTYKGKNFKKNFTRKNKSAE